MRHLSTRLVLATSAVLAAATFGSRQIVTLLMPALSSALSLVADDFRILRFELVTDRGNASIAALALLDHTIILGGRAIVPDGTSPMLVGTTVGTVLQPLLAALVLVIAWPAKPAEMLLRISIAIVLTFGVLMADTPFSMAAWLWEVQVRAHEPDRTSPLIWWNIFLNGGGRLALGLIAAVLSIALAQRACAGRRSASRDTAEGTSAAPEPTMDPESQ
ncbi:MAG: hypothetical protein ACKVOX_11045 [Rhizobacter sp.]